MALLLKNAHVVDPSVELDGRVDVLVEDDKIAAVGENLSHEGAEDVYKRQFLLDTLELYTTRRRMKTAQARLRSNRSMSSDERRELAIQATRDAARIRELEQAVEGDVYKRQL